MIILNHIFRMHAKSEDDKYEQIICEIIRIYAWQKLSRKKGIFEELRESWKKAAERVERRAEKLVDHNAVEKRAFLKIFLSVWRKERGQNENHIINKKSSNNKYVHRRDRVNLLHS